jgi:hypothetical protein
VRDAYHTEGVTDLKAFQASALGRLENPHYPGYPDSTRVHYHAKGEPCDGHKHEEHLLPEDAERRMTEVESTMEFAEDRFDAGSQ